MTPDPYRPVDTDEVLRRVDVHARVGAELLGDGEGNGFSEPVHSDFLRAVGAAAEAELASVAHDLARACLLAHTKFAAGVDWIVHPEKADDLHAAIRMLHARVHPEAAPLSLPKPGVETDIRPLLAALELCKRLEGHSDRVRFAEAELPGIHGQWDEVERRARILAEDTESPSWGRSAGLLRAHALIAMEQGAAARALLQKLASEDGVDRLLLANLACACALEGDVNGFAAAAADFAACETAENETFDWSQWVHTWAGWFGKRLKQESREIEFAFGQELEP